MEKIKRDTNEDLMNNVLELVKKCHCYDKAEKIMLPPVTMGYSTVAGSSFAPIS